jgi:DNA-binding PadR family transcriptional regulator
MYPRRIYYRDMPTPKTYPPLTPAVLYILMALADSEKHGYAIMKQVETDSEHNVSMGPGTLYGSLKRMLEAGLVTEGDKKVDPEMDDQRRIYYKITDIGRQALEAELKRYRRVIALTKRHASGADMAGYGV